MGQRVGDIKVDEKLMKIDEKSMKIDENSEIMYPINEKKQAGIGLEMVVNQCTLPFLKGQANFLEEK